MRIDLKKILAVGILLILSLFINAQEYNFRHYHPENGLKGTYVYTTTADSKGYKWIGTDFGLVRFDGLNFETIDSNDSTQTKFTTSSLNKDDSSLLFGYYNGLIKEYSGGDLKTIYQPVSGMSPIRSIISDGEIIWALTQNKGIVKIENGIAKLLTLPELTYRKSTAITLFHNQLLIGTNEGIVIYKMENGSLTYNGEIASLNDKSIQTITLSMQENALWVGTDGDGIYKIEGSSKNNTLNLKVEKANFLKQESVISIKETNNSNLWIGTKYEGLVKVNFNRENAKSIQFTSLKTKNRFPSDQISTLFLDDHENIWAGTTGDGLIQVIQKGIVFYNFEKFRTKSIYAITSTSNHQYFFGSDVGLIKGTYKGTEDSLTFEIIQHEQILRNAVTALYLNENSILYFAVKNKGVFFTNPSFSNVQQLVFDHGVKELSVRQITEDKEGNLWISVMKNGVFVVGKNGEIKKHYATHTGFYHNEIYHIHIDSKGNKWFAAHAAGLAVENSKGEITYLSKDGVFPARDVNDISEDKDGNIWIGTYGNGVYEYDGKTFIRFSDQEGLLNNYTNSVISDRNNHIWVSHRTGLTRIDENTNAISTFQEKDGLLVSEFIHNSIYSDFDHNIWLGNRSGVTFLNTPDEIFEPKILETIITDIKIDHRSVDLSTFSKEKKISAKIPKKIVFPYDQNNLTFDFIAINLKNPQSNLYQFQLEGYEADWSPTITENSISYTNLNPGRYSFKVRQSDNSNHWSSAKITKLDFDITPAWWNTILARIIFAVIVILLIYKIASIRTAQLSRRLKKRQKFHEITESQNKRLMNYSFITSHNTRASVGNILGLITLIELDPNNSDYFKKLKKSALKLNDTIDDINELLNFENNTEVQMSKCNVIEVIDRTITHNERLIKSRNAQIELDVDEDLCVLGVPSYLESILNNILTNALRYGVTETNKKIVVQTKSEAGFVNISFKDCGLGIDMKKHRSKLFELGSRFHTSKSDGNGLGLFMTKNQVETMDGKIEIESAVEKGTIVNIFLKPCPENS